MAGQSAAKAHSKTRNPGGRRPPGSRRRDAGFGRGFCVAAAGHAAGEIPPILMTFLDSSDCCSILVFFVAKAVAEAVGPPYEE